MNMKDKLLLDTIKNTKLEPGDGSDSVVTDDNADQFYYTYDFTTTGGRLKLNVSYHHLRDNYDNFDDFLEFALEDHGYDDDEGGKQVTDAYTWQYAFDDPESAMDTAGENGEEPYITVDGTIVSILPISEDDLFRIMKVIRDDIDDCVEAYIDAWKESCDFQSDPLGYYGMKQSDFL